MQQVQLRSLATVLLFLVCLSQASCSFLLAPQQPPVRFQLNADLDSSLFSPFTASKKQIVVGRPDASVSLDTDRVSLFFGGRELKYLAKYRFTEPVGSLIQKNIVEALVKSGKFKGVGDDVIGLAGDEKLLISLQQFSIFYEKDGTKPRAVFQANFQLMDLSSKNILDTLPLDIQVPAASNDAKDLFQALESALQKGVEQVALWLCGQKQGVR